MKHPDCDFSGYVTKYGILCDDGTTIAKGAFADQDGATLPIVWNHDHSDLNNVIGHCVLESRDDGMYGYAYMNDETDLGKAAKVRVKHGDLSSFSIWANNLKKAGARGRDILHGALKEVSLVVAGANRGAVIDTVLAHGADSNESGEYLIYTSPSEDSRFIMHSAYYNEDMTKEELAEIGDDDDDDDDSKLEHSADTATQSTEPAKTSIGKLFTIVPNEEQANASIAHSADESANAEDPTFADVFKTLNETQKKMFITAIAYEQEKNQNGGNEVMHSVFTGNADPNTNENVNNEALQHSADIVKGAFMNGEKFGYFKDAFIAHAANYGIDNIEILFPEAQAITKTPEFIKRRTEWVASVLDGANHAPFAKVKSWFADITEDEARAKGYIKGTRKKEEVFKVLQRTTEPTTVYKKQKFDRDDWKDITTLDALVWLKSEMKLMLEEEVAVAMLIGDGREFGNPDKVNEEKIRPIWTDDELYTVAIQVPVSATADVDAKAKALIRSLIKARKYYYGSGNATFYTTEDNQADMLLLDDGIGHPLYPTVESLKTRIRASEIKTVQPMEGRNRVIDGKTHFLAGILVNMKDYTVGTDKGGKVDFFDDFDINYNQHIMLTETRMSGALTRAYSALVFEFVYDLVLQISADTQATAAYDKLVSDLQDNDVYVNEKSIQGTLKYISNWSSVYGPDTKDNTGNFLALRVVDTPDSETTLRIIGGLYDDRIVTFTSEDHQAIVHICSTAQKLVFRSVIHKGTANEQVIERTLSCSGLKLNKA